jgi:hypothetical protein
MSSDMKFCRLMMLFHAIMTVVLLIINELYTAGLFCAMAHIYYIGLLIIRKLDAMGDL